MSIYQIITDRFARTDGSTDECKGYIQTMKYCGGTWVGIKNKIEYISNMGFDAIWISPVWKNLPNAYHGYSIVDLEKLNEHFGTDQDFKDMINAAHAKKINVMVDVVPNHMGSVMFDYEKLNPFNKAEYFHDYCYIQDNDYQHNQWRITNCRLLNLPDLKQEHPFVRKTMLAQVENFVRDFSVDGLRLDAVPHMPHWFLQEYYEAAKKGTVPAKSN
jgi:alpha-amylase